MIGGVSGGYPVPVSNDRTAIGRGTDPRDRPVLGPDQAAAKDTQADRRGPQPGALVQSADEGALFQRRIEALAQAQAARLEADDAALPRQSQQALRTYGDISASREDSDVELVGLDLRV